MLGAIAFERGQRDEAQGNYNGASAEYRKAADAFPDATLPMARLGIVRYQAGDFSGAARIFNYLVGRKADAKVIRHQGIGQDPYGAKGLQPAHQ